jgi:hypothetical protein
MSNASVLDVPRNAKAGTVVRRVVSVGVRAATPIDVHAPVRRLTRRVPDVTRMVIGR